MARRLSAEFTEWAMQYSGMKWTSEDVPASGLGYAHNTLHTHVRHRPTLRIWFEDVPASDLGHRRTKANERVQTPHSAMDGGTR